MPFEEALLTLKKDFNALNIKFTDDKLTVEDMMDSRNAEKYEYLLSDSSRPIKMALIAACERGSLGDVKAIIANCKTNEKGLSLADILNDENELENGFCKPPCLLVAAEGGHIELVQYLLDHGAEPGIVYYNGLNNQSCLHFIIEKISSGGNPMAISVDERKLQTPGYDHDKVDNMLQIMEILVSRMTLDDINYKDITDVVSMSPLYVAYSKYETPDSLSSGLGLPNFYGLTAEESNKIMWVIINILRRHGGLADKYSSYMASVESYDKTKIKAIDDDAKANGYDDKKLLHDAIEADEDIWGTSTWIQRGYLIWALLKAEFKKIP